MAIIMWTFFSVIAIFMGIFELWCGVKALDNGLALTPPMGFSPWERFCWFDPKKCQANPEDCLSESLIKRTAIAMVEKGFKDAGYEYVIVDGCWSAAERDSNGRLQPDPERFPSGFNELSDFLHSLGLKFGISQNYGKGTCNGFPGVKDNLDLDAKTFADWGVDYVKLNAWGSKINEMNVAYPEFGRALNATGRPIVYSCTWPLYLDMFDQTPDYALVKEHCNLWRIEDDSFGTFNSVRAAADDYIDSQDDIQCHAGPGHWNDPDSLVIGDYGLTIDHSKYQMALWAIVAAPLLMSTDLVTIRPEFAEILLNKEIIKINQDPMGIQGRHIKTEHNIEVWVRPITPIVDNYHSYAVALFNNRPFLGPSPFTFNLSELNLTYENGYQIKDLFDSQKKFDVFMPTDVFKVRVNPTGAVMYTFTPQHVNKERR